MPMMIAHTLKFVNSMKTQKSKYPEDEILLIFKKKNKHPLSNNMTKNSSGGKLYPNLTNYF